MAESKTYKLGTGLKIEGNYIVVDTAKKSEKGNKKPMSSNGVAEEVGNIEELLTTI